MRIPYSTRSSFLKAFVAAAFAMGAATALESCTNNAQEVTGSGTAYKVQELTGSIDGLSVIAMDGVYGPDCEGFPNYPGWSVPTNGFSPGTLDFPLLAVAQNNTQCELYLTKILMSPTPNSPSPSSTQAFGAMTNSNLPHGLPVGPTYAPPMGFVHSGGTEADFFGTALYNPSGFATNFTVVFEYASDPSVFTVSVPTGYAPMVTATSVASSPNAPDYGSKPTLITYSTSPAFSILAASNNVVVSAQGWLTLSALVQQGEYYTIVASFLLNGTNSPTGSDSNYNDVAWTFTQSLQAPLPAGQPIVIDATDIVEPDVTNLTGGLTYYIIVQHTDPSTTLVSYEVITLNIPQP